MHPELITLPGGFSVKTYGFCLMVGFLSAVWFAMRRATRVKADPDIILDLSFLSLIFGVGGARAFYVIHYWQTQFADAPNKLFAVVDITKGGLEFLGGFLGATAAAIIYARAKKISIRLYLDIMAPGAMWGLAFGRVGCLFNGCCFGGPCVEPGTDHAAQAWAMRFPYGSAPHVHQWEDRLVTVPAELITVEKEGLLAYPIPETLFAMSVDRRERPRAEYSALKNATERAETGATADASSIQAAKAKLAADETTFKRHEAELGPLRRAQEYPSPKHPTRPMTVSELEDLAASASSLPIHPTQLYAALDAILLSAILSALFYVRKRHGVVIGALFLLHPLSRAILETIRVDNPADVAGLTVSQFVSLTMFAAGVAAMFVLYKRLPERSPLLDKRA